MSTWLHLLVSEQEAENCSSETFDETGFDCTCQFTDEEGCCYYSWKIYECYGFGKSNTLTSYTDHGGCGFWGNDAQANLSQCDHGYYKAHFKPIDDWKYVAYIDGCGYYEYTIYECKTGSSTKTTDSTNTTPQP